ncbi:RRQRL motif-containing zinc-binding protein [Pseudonocardia sp. EC080625-04]|uniref:RRQRL motif-containing zinc-binding protein n=1 Tax=Pseudonocardia sp. EC080625-04 TaxID=1096868 RepID=UPI000A594C29|nr:RRQRL motif-containing zinc-binding protein [Pseudonocardia sp. EC080625-04]
MSAPAGHGVMTERWGWQPTAWLQDGLPTWRWRAAPTGLMTRRQMRDADLAPCGAHPVAQVVCRRGRRWALLWDVADLGPKRIPSTAQLAALDRALAARRRCPACSRDVGYCIPRSLGSCLDCHTPPTAAAQAAA